MTEPKLSAVAVALAQILDSYETGLAGPAVPPFLKTTSDADGRTIIFAGNRRGLLQVASVLVALAQINADGQHFQLSQSNALSNSSHNLILMLQNPPQPSLTPAG